MSNRIWIIPGKLEAEPFGNSEKLGELLDTGVMLLNSDYVNYEDAKAKFRKACNMPDGKLAVAAYKKPVTYNDNIMRLAAYCECQRRSLVKKLKKEQRGAPRA